MSRDLIEETAQVLLVGFDSYIRDFNALTEQTPVFFKTRDWKAMQQNHRGRLRLYKDQVRATRQLLNEVLQENSNNFDFWKSAKSFYSSLISNKKDKELAETFFNSVIRKSYSGLAINEDLMFVHEGYNSCLIYPTDNLYYSYPSEWGLKKQSKRSWMTLILVFLI
jgi:isocitrate dehydrogenase kinase/phosphatase